MTLPLAEILGTSQVWLMMAILVFLRVGACFLVLPTLAEQYIPPRVRLGAALAMTALLVPALAPQLTGSAATLNAIYFLTEPLAGLLIGLSVRFAVHALQIAGSMAAQSTSLSQIAGGAAPEPQPAMANFLMLAGMTLAVMSGFHVLVARMLIASYDVLPAGQVPLAGDIGAWGTARVAAAFRLAFSLAAPFLIASVLYNVALGVINKAMPQLLVAFVGAPAITFGGLFLLFLSTPFLLPAWMQMMQATLAAPMSIPP
jgi:flagellar biosynthesis protein FliR